MWSGSTSTSSLFAHVVHFLWWALEHEEVTPAEVTMAWLLKKTDGTPGVVDLVLCKALLVSHIAIAVAELPESSTLRQELASVLEKFQNYTCFDAAFNSETAGEAARRAEEPVDGEADKYQIFRKSLSTMPNAMLAFLFDVFSNRHDKDLEKMCRNH